MRGEKVRDEPFGGKDIGSLDVPELERLAADTNRKINAAGVLLTGLYWDLGMFLLDLKERYGRHGTWEKRLAKMGIDRTRATKATAIKRTFRCRKDCEQMSVDDAYAMRKRKKTVEYTPPDPHDNSSFSPTEDLHVYNTPYQELEQQGRITPGSVDLMPCDPPYVGDWLPQLPDLAAFAARVLKPNGLAAIYYGKDHLDSLFREMDKQHLKYLAMFCHPYEIDGMRSVNHLHIEVCWKPVVLFGKGTWKSPRKIEDMLPAFPAEKTRDYWEQPLGLVEWLLEMFSEEGDLVVDPVAGTFTVMEACFNKHRRCIACDIDPAMMLHARQRWEAIKRGIYDDLHADAAGAVPNLTDENQLLAESCFARS